MTPATLQALVDRQDVADTVVRYAGALDARDWAAARASDNTFDTLAHYTHALARTPQGWRITGVRQVVAWNRGNPAVHAGARAPGGAPMPVDRPYVADNDAERERLRALVRRLGDHDLARPMAAGWTVAGVLAHLAFWDQRIVVLLDEWERRGPAWAPPQEARDDVDWINDAAKPLCLALPPRAAAELALSVAETVDRRVAAVSDALLEANARAGAPLNWRRAAHRREHLDEIERALQ
jgi:hypothetical protein